MRGSKRTQDVEVRRSPDCDCSSSGSDSKQRPKRQKRAVGDDSEWLLPWKKPEPDGEWPLKQYPKGDVRADMQLPAPVESRPEIDTSKPTSIFKPTTGGTLSTLTIAIPASTLNLAQTFELKAQLAGRIARSAAVFCVDEIVIFEDGEEGGSDAMDILMHILQYLECPPHLRRRMFPSHPYLRTAGALPSLDMPHHLRRDEWCQYREGIILSNEDLQSVTNASGDFANGHSRKRKHNSDNDHSNNATASYGSRLSPPKKHKSHSKPDSDESAQGNPARKLNEAQSLGAGANATPSSDLSCESKTPNVEEEVAYTLLVDCGFPFTIAVSTRLLPNTRVTLRFPSPNPPPNFSLLQAPRWYGPDAAEPEFRAEVVDANDPKEKDGYYWGYEVRTAANLTRVFAGCPYEGGYDITIGTSERGKPLNGINPLTRSESSSSNKQNDMLPERFQHALIVFGGAAGLERALEYDTELLGRVGGNQKEVGQVFDFFVNAVPGQGSRTIRSEEAVWIVLGQLDSWIKSARM